MSKLSKIQYQGYRTAAIIIGLSIILVTGLSSARDSFVLFPILAAMLFVFVYKETKRFNIVFLVYLTVTMIAEVTFLYDFEQYAIIALVATILGSVALLLLIKPAIKKETTTFSRHNIIELIIGFLGVGYVMFYLAYIIIPMVPYTFLFILSSAMTTITTVVCFIIPSFNKHPDNVALFGIAGASIAELGFAFIYEYIFQEMVFLLISMFMACCMKVILATYLLRLQKKDSFEV